MVAPANTGATVSLTERMRDRTRVLHAQAERSGVINDVLRGRASRHAYALMLRNLVPAYERLEAALETHRDSFPVRCVARRELYRSAALASDLSQIIGSDWAGTLPLLPAGEAYALRIAAAARGDGVRLIAHAYTRYLGDLSGGQVLKCLLGRSLGLAPQELSFYEFPKIADAEKFKKDYKTTLDETAAALAESEPIIVEAIAAFELNIAVSEAVQQASAVLA